MYKNKQGFIALFIAAIMSISGCAPETEQVPLLDVDSEHCESDPQLVWDELNDIEEWSSLRSHDLRGDRMSEALANAILRWNIVSQEYLDTLQSQLGDDFDATAWPDVIIIDSSSEEFSCSSSHSECTYKPSADEQVFCRDSEDADDKGRAQLTARFMGGELVVLADCTGKDTESPDFKCTLYEKIPGEGWSPLAETTMVLQ